MEFVLSFGFFIVMLVIGGGIGRLRERKHVRELDEREARTAHVVVTNLKTTPVGMAVGGGALVLGEVVIANDYLKAWLAQMRGIFGGELRSYQVLLTRARREARLRMVEQAQSLGASVVINLRFETSEIGSTQTSRGAGAPTTEVLCHGTALFPPRF